MPVLNSILHYNSLLNKHLRFILPSCWYFTTAYVNVDLSILRTYFFNLFLFCWIYPHFQGIVICFVFKNRVFCSVSQQLRIWSFDSGILFYSYSKFTAAKHGGCYWCVVYQHSCLFMELWRCYNLHGNYRFV